MKRVLTDGKTSIGAFMFPDRKRPCLCIEKGAEVVVYGHFNSIESADKFIDRLAELVNAQKEGADNG